VCRLPRQTSLGGTDGIPWGVREGGPPVAGRPDSLTRQSRPAFARDMANGRWPSDELASFNIVVEKWDSSKIGGKRDGSKESRERPHRRVAAQDAASSIQDQVAGMPAAAQAALL
jgi:hypothetical protein